ncbi:MAG TPA: LLM class flavin-dependent oxidoreductase [Acidimicrobiales bacterium]|nr:LLM class flavin-dependent oxidoreductase [Acidimicrobiales bacterium]
MDVGLALPQFDFSVPGRSPLPWDAVVEWATAAEASGLDSVWLADHLFWSIEKYGGPPGRSSALDPIAALAGLARATTTVGLGTLVLCAQLRPPTVAAKALVTVDVLSGGRLSVGLGAGWYEPEFEAAGVPFERPGVRLQQLAEAVEVYKAMFTGGWNDAPCRPRPVQEPRPPVFVGGRGDRLLNVVARHADGWNTGWRHTPESYRVRAAVLDAACERAGRDPATVERSLNLYTLVGEDEADVRRRYERLQALTPPGVIDATPLEEWRKGALVGTVEQVREQLGAWAEVGVAHLIACLGALPFAVTDVDDLSLLAAVRKGA